MNSTVQHQRKRFRSGKTSSLKARRAALDRLRTLIESKQEQILEALHDDLGKGKVEAYVSEVAFVLGEIRHARKRLKRWMKPQKRRTPLSLWRAKSTVHAEPLGVSLILGPWNYPFQLLMVPLVSALAAGNTAVLKPSEFAPRTAELMARLLREAFDEDQVAVVTGDAEVAKGLLSERFDKIFFTGGSDIGREVMKAAARYLTPVTLELGGKSPCIVAGDTDLQVAARRITWGKFLNAGQTCVAPDHVWVKRGKGDALIQLLREEIAEFYEGNSKASEDYSRIVNERHFDRLMAMLDGTEPEIGGRHDREQLHIEPTVVRLDTPDHLLMEEEIFGPILPVIEYDSIAEVVEYQEGRSPLALYLFSDDDLLTQRVLSEIRSGGVCINDTLSHLLNRELPFGGLGESGMGACHGKAGFDAFSHQRAVMKRKLSPDPKFRYPPIKVGLGKLKKILRFFGEG
ncbi:MAG: aldehyde dehydrogenase [Akkermansiaceae bacterium]|nr:aldehyde dehydrogenase [Akkermansiaceae bacterium]